MRPPFRFVVRPMIGDPGGEPWSPNSLAELRRLSELKPEPVETVTSTGDPTPDAIDRMLRHEFPIRAEELLARYAEITEAIEDGCQAKPFDPFAADKLSKQLHALLGEMAEEGARIRQERGYGRK